MANTLLTRVEEAATGASRKSLHWTRFATAIAGLWLASGAVMSSTYSDLQIANDIACGIAITVLSLWSFAGNKDWLRWIIGSLGAWLLLSPLFFWAPTAFHYDTSNLIGTLVITFSFLIPGQPGAKNYAGHDIPPGWTYNPSSWEQRGPLIAIAIVGYFLARYLAAYQLGYLNSAWDPFFGNGTEKILNSEISKAFIISDAGLGAASYLIDALEGFLGRKDRWRTMPWAVVIFALTIVPAGVTSVVLVMLQPIGVGAWCSICLLLAVLMLIMVPFAFDELVATAQFLNRTRKRKQSLWHAFIFGGTDEMTDEEMEAAQKPVADGKEKASYLLSGFTGINFPPTLLASAAIGIWVMASPTVLGIESFASDSQHLVGALIVTVAISSMAEACRAFRLVNVLCGTWLLLSLLLLPGFPQDHAWTNLVAGFLLVALSIPRGKIEESYGTFDRFVF